jgi:integrase
LDALSKAELLALLGAARAHSERDFLMILMAYSHGLRASEVLAIEPDSVRDGLLEVQRLKGSLHTTQPLLSSDEPLLEERKAWFHFENTAESKSVPHRPAALLAPGAALRCRG